MRIKMLHVPKALTRFSVAAVAMNLALPSLAERQSAAPAAEVQSGRDDVPDDIVVEGYRRRPDLKTRARVPVAISTSRNRATYAQSELLAKCAARSRLSALAQLRAVVDGAFNTAAMLMAQDRLKRTYITCSESPVLLSFTSPPQSDLTKSLLLDAGDGGAVRGGRDILSVGDAAPLGRSIYDRGAFTIQALKMYAPDLRLTRAQTSDRTVQSRFNLREIPRNRFRLQVDYDYFAVAVCIVRVEPALSVRLAFSDGGARFGDLQAALIDRARVCVGGARNVQVDPTQFRLYIGDAVYRWAVAARGVDSLIPERGG